VGSRVTAGVNKFHRVSDREVSVPLESKTSIVAQFEILFQSVQQEIKIECG